ncbi:MAG: hypothetical protein CMM58_06820 [Rhodospirillaceae bacterium]|nr:hypothetical protein [Rhodospirillaceae bacterium]
MKRRPTGDLLFQVSLISDTHVNEAEDFSTSPYPANAEANPRARYIFDQINQSGSAFCIHLGDMVNPVPELTSYIPATERFHEISSSLSMPLYLMPGNHDIGDKPVTWMPAGMINDEQIELYRNQFGNDYFSFSHEKCHFIIINSPLINSGQAAEAEQASWLENDLEQHKNQRVFIFSHYPVYVSNRWEPESYDNIDEPGRSWLLKLIQRYQPEALFAAHVHNFWYDVIHDTEYYIVPSTCFVRHDYSEMYRIDGGSQQGRNDIAKLGHITLKIYETGHVTHYHRSYAGCLAENTGHAPPVVQRPHVKTTALTDLYVDMRHAWTEEITVAPSGAVDEFRRKIARNDYPIMALWEMGLRGLRVPIQDLEDPKTRHRMRLMIDLGHHFHVYRYGMPDDPQNALLSEYGNLISQLELVLGWDEIDNYTRTLADLKRDTGLSIILSRVNRKDSGKFSGGRFNHLISHGFSLAELTELSDFLKNHKDLVSGLQFSIPRSISPWNAAAQVANFSRENGCRSFLYIKSTEASPAERFNDEISNSLRFGEAVLSAIGHQVPIILDTFDDADRGYFTRTGLVDRRFNPRISSQLISELIQRLDKNGPWHPSGGTTALLTNRKGDTIRIGQAADCEKGEVLINPVTGKIDTDDNSELYLIQKSTGA